VALRRSDDPFVSWLRGLHPGQPGDRQRWLAWAAMVTLMAKASKPERHRWHRDFDQLSALEHDATLSESERGAAFVALLKDAWPMAPRRGREPDDVRLLSDFPRIEAHLAGAWPKGEEAKRAAVADVERDAKLDLGDNRPEVLATSSPRWAALLILAHAYEEDVRTVEQALRRARRRQNEKIDL
jgi:hypothetical protein